MSERKVLSKWFPPDFDPSALGRQRKPKQAGPRVITVRLMAPFSMRCLTCGEYLPKGRKFNARKETNQEEKYLGIQIFRFYIRCTRCSAEITFKTDPRVNDYVCERGAKRNTEPWRPLKEETDEERLDRLEKEEEERNAMEELEAKTVDAKREMAVADMLDEIRTSNARRDRTGGGDMAPDAPPVDEEAERQEREDLEAARRAFARHKEQALSEQIGEEKIVMEDLSDMPPPPVPFKREKPVKKVERLPGLKRKEPPTTTATTSAQAASTPTSTSASAPQSQSNPPVQAKAGLAGLVDYGSDSD
ncbi:mrna splicing protein yju2 protein [Apiospora hydei]|uniref:Splicing factor YJU2 n=1 Tax=Apiospora hydei TaxID=1337664 RepID=A0ABR1V6Z4_9PEZI